MNEENILHGLPEHPDYHSGGIVSADHEDHMHNPHVDAEPVVESVEEVHPSPRSNERQEWPKVLGKYGRLGVKASDPRVYSRGEHVETLIAALGWQGNEFTEELANEVKQIQEENGVPVTGRVDQVTWNLIVNK